MDVNFVVSFVTVVTAGAFFSIWNRQNPVRSDRTALAVTTHGDGVRR